MEILIVDDEEHILETLKSHLELDGIKVKTATSAEEAISLHWANLFPVILTDIRMSNMSGLDLIREVKVVHPTCIVFVMTGYASLMNMTECLEAGAADYYIKPFENLEMVIKSVKDAIARYERWMKDLRFVGRGRTT